MELKELVQYCLTKNKSYEEVLKSFSKKVQAEIKREEI